MDNEDAILTSLRQHLNPQTIERMSTRIGADPAATSNAVSMALPALLAGLSRNASTPAGATALDSALKQHDGGILGNLGSLFGDGAGTSGGIGAAILGHIFGGKRSSVEAGVGKASGLDSQQIGQLLVMLAPIVMGVLGKMKQQKGLDANQLPDVLGRSATRMEKDSPISGGIASMLDANRDGQIMDDLGRMGTSVLGGLFRK